jgi:hypothetical protein
MKRIKTLTLAATILALTLGAFPNQASAYVRPKVPRTVSTADVVSILLSVLLP